MTQNHWYITIILSTLRVSGWYRKGVARVSGFWNKGGTLVKTPICDTSPTPIRHLFDTLGVGILPFFGHISATSMPILTRFFPDPVAVIRAPLIVVLVDESRANFVFHLTICSASTNTFPAILIRSSFEV